MYEWNAVADGFHLSRFFNEVQELIDSLDISATKASACVETISS